MVASTAPGSAPSSEPVEVLQPPATGAPVTKPRRRGSRWRQFCAIDERPAWIELARTRRGRVALFAVAGVLLLFSLPPRAAVVVVVGAAAAAFLRTHRDKAVLAATLLVLMLDPTWFMDSTFEAHLAEIGAGATWSARNLTRFLTVGLFVTTAVVLHRVARKPEGLFARRPVLCMLGLIGASCGTCLWIERGAVSMWFVLSIKILAAYMWFVCYAVVDQRSSQRSSKAMSLGTLRPFWGSSSTPIGKGSGYLAKLRCKDEQELAVTQLKAIKLLGWSVVLQGSSLLLASGAQRAGVPALDAIVADFTQGKSTAIAFGWAALVLAVAIGAIDLAAWGHRVVACARLAGWKLRRNTWRPLESRSLADFWNRYYYYFKELLLDFFFYPTFFRYFKKLPRLRTFVATFMAAGVGNVIYHFVRDIDRVLAFGPWVAIQSYGSYAFYCVALAGAIGISQVRGSSGGHPAGGGVGARLRSFAVVWGFVVLIHVFGGIEDRTISFVDRLSFLVHQFGFYT
jgi:hypothetical protein